MHLDKSAAASAISKNVQLFLNGFLQSNIGLPTAPRAGLPIGSNAGSVEGPPIELPSLVLEIKWRESKRLANKETASFLGLKGEETEGVACQVFHEAQ